jgi:hypothetical protein
VLAALGHPFQSREPEIVATVHEGFVGLAQMGSVIALADLIRDNEAGIPLKLNVCPAASVGSTRTNWPPSKTSNW